MAIEVMVPGSCGELVQGIINEVNFHITCPINRYSHVKVSTIKGRGVDLPWGFDKTARAAAKALEISGVRHGVKVEIKSELSKGKGMASSTADITATLIGIFTLLGRATDYKEIADIALAIEPTDGTFFNGIVAFDHLGGKTLTQIGEAPPIEIIVLEPPERVDTVEFNRKKRDVRKSDELFVKEAFEIAVEGVKTKDVRMIGEAATLSSLMNQTQLNKPALNDIIEVCKSKGGLGVNVAHSGTVYGVLAEEGFAGRLFDKISHYIPRSWDAYVVNMVDGGAVLEAEELSFETRKVLI